MFESKATEKDKKAVANAADVALAQARGSVFGLDTARVGSTTKAGTVSYLGSGMSIVGNIECDGAAQVFGRVKGELRASDLLIGEAAQVEGTVIAQEVTVCGRVKGSIRAVRVKLQAGGVVEGDIFHRALSVDENSRFEGSSRRVENPTDSSSNIHAKGEEKQDLQSSAPHRTSPTAICSGIEVRIGRCRKNCGPCCAAAAGSRSGHARGACERQSMRCEPLLGRMRRGEAPRRRRHVRRGPDQAD